MDFVGHDQVPYPGYPSWDFDTIVTKEVEGFFFLGHEKDDRIFRFFPFVVLEQFLNSAWQFTVGQLFTGSIRKWLNKLCRISFEMRALLEKKKQFFTFLGDFFPSNLFRPFMMCFAVAYSGTTAGSLASQKPMSRTWGSLFFSSLVRKSTFFTLNTKEAILVFWVHDKSSTPYLWGLTVLFKIR